MNPSSRLALWERLRDARLVEGTMPDAGEGSVPWFVRLMQGIGGWMGAMFLLSFVGAAFALVFKSAGASLLMGAGACGVAVAIFRAAPKSDFMAQFGLATSLAGQFLLAFGFSDMIGHSANRVALILLLQEALLFFLIPNYLHRLLCAWSGALAAVWLIVDAGFFAFAPAAVTAAFLWVWLSEFEFGRHGALARAGGYGLALAAVQTAVMHGGLWMSFMGSMGKLPTSHGVAVEWMGHAASAAVLLWAVIRLLRREGLSLGSGPGKVALAAALILGVLSMKAPGVGPAAAILIAGYANGNRVLAGLGIFALVGYLSHYYYALHATLLEKSALLAAGGMALLLARLAMRRWWPDEREAGHA